jgi:hypothetical protein
MRQNRMARRSALWREEQSFGEGETCGSRGNELIPFNPDGVEPFGPFSAGTDFGAIPFRKLHLRLILSFPFGEHG